MCQDVVFAVDQHSLYKCFMFISNYQEFYLAHEHISFFNNLDMTFFAFISCLAAELSMKTKCIR